MSVNSSVPTTGGPGRLANLSEREMLRSWLLGLLATSGLLSAGLLGIIMLVGFILDRGGAS